jgi:hypothetical protein
MHAGCVLCGSAWKSRSSPSNSAPGAGVPSRIDWHVDRLCRIADAAGRPLTLVVRGGAQVLHRLKRHFGQVILVETDAFARTLKRCWAEFTEAGRLRWPRISTPKGAPIDDLLAHNIVTKRTALLLSDFAPVTRSERPARNTRRSAQHADGQAGQGSFLAQLDATLEARVDPGQVRHFRLEPADRTARVRGIRLPENDEDTAKFVREAVRTYPELYFARFVILGEGASEEVVLPRLAEALDLPIDRSFVAMVPLGGRHVNHLWRLLGDLAIPYATLLDLDWGRDGGGWGRIKTSCEQLLAVGRTSTEVFGAELGAAQISPSSPSFT